MKLHKGQVNIEVNPNTGKNLITLCLIASENIYICSGDLLVLPN
jgi:hypothetical protein